MWGLFCFGCLIGCALIQYQRVLPSSTWISVWIIIGFLVAGLGGATYYLIRYWEQSKNNYCGCFFKKRKFFSGVNTLSQSTILTYLFAIILFFTGLSLMAGYTLYQAHQRLGDALSKQYESKVSHLVVRVNSIAHFGKSLMTFDAEVLSAYKVSSGIPRYLRIYWQPNKVFQLYQEATIENMPDIRPGQVWDVWLLLKRPNTLINPGGFDNETYLFRENIRAIGMVKGKPILLHDEQHNFYTRIQAWRHDLRQSMQHYMKGKRYAAVLIALVIGDQEGIAQEDWRLFNRTGMTHLVSISGSHITMLSALTVMLSMCLLKRVRYRGKLVAEYIPITLLAGAIGVGVALMYCLLAGWGIPAQRTFFMLLLTYILHVFNVRLSLPLIFLLIGTLVSIFDPWAMLSTGFYLSFAAVAVLQQLGVRYGHARSLKNRPTHSQHNIVLKEKVKCALVFLKNWSILQGIMTLAIIPFLIYFFHQVSLVSPLVNAYAIFLVGMIVTPLALCMGGLSTLVDRMTFLQEIVQVLADIAHQVLYWVMQLSQYLSEWQWASIDISYIPWRVLGIFGVGIVLLLLPRGLPLQRWAILLVIPAFVFTDNSLRHGEWQLYAFDIGQGGAILVQTAHHHILFDTGARVSATNESGSRVLLPAFRALGVKNLDVLVISHADLDHSGGLKTILENIPVQKIYASFQVDKFLLQERERLGEVGTSQHNMMQQHELLSVSYHPTKSLLKKWLYPDTYEACRQRVSFVFDGVKFRFLNRMPSVSSSSFPSSLTTHMAKSTINSDDDVKLQVKRRDISDTSTQLPTKSTNRQSCILSIEGKYHRALLTGDMLVEQEQWLIAEEAINQPYDVLQVPHHGSKSSSSQLFVNHIQPLIAIAQTGFLNRFKHPHPVIQQRWQDSGAVFLNTAQTGAVQVISQAIGISYHLYREKQRHYWHR